MFAENGKYLVVTDSMGKYLELGDTDVRAYRGYTITNVTDRIRFGQLNVAGYSRILIHVGSNDISNMIDQGEHRVTTIFDMMGRYVALRNSIRRRNSRAILLFSSVLPRVNRYKLFRAYISGLNFAIEKWCAKTSGTCIYIPCFNSFISHGKPKSALFSGKDGLHLDGGGVDVLEGLFQQALSSGYLRVRLNTERTRKLKSLR